MWFNQIRELFLMVCCCFLLPLVMTAQTNCEDEPCAQAPGVLSNGPTACESKLYCSNSSAVDNGFINCTTAADTDGCGIDASEPATPVPGDAIDMLLSELPDNCYETGDNVQ